MDQKYGNKVRLYFWEDPEIINWPLSVGFYIYVTAFVDSFLVSNFLLLR